MRLKTETLVVELVLLFFSIIAFVTFVIGMYFAAKSCEDSKE